MPSSPKKKKRPWVKERKQQHRAVNMNWYYNDPRWRKFSKQFKIDNPLCVKCKAKGLCVPTEFTDHIVRLRDGGGADLNKLNKKDFQPLCGPCHNSKSGKEAHGYKEGDMGNIANV